MSFLTYGQISVQGSYQYYYHLSYYSSSSSPLLVTHTTESRGKGEK
jgi:hypothetical protein